MQSRTQPAVDEPERFAFGRNWQNYLRALDDRKIDQSIAGLQTLLGVKTLEGLRFLDIGCGSGLSSLAAHRLGAIVHSFDFDMESVEATSALKERYASSSGAWTIGQGSVLDADLIASLGRWDVVYSWGVLHHTGQMWRAIDNAINCVAPGGRLAIAIYNDQGRISRWWASIKRFYVRHPTARPLLLAGSLVVIWGWTFALDLKHLRPGASWRAHGQERGMSAWHDLVDWVGGYPFEVATPEAIFTHCRNKGFTLDNLVTRQGRGCNEFVFSRTTT